MFRDLVMQEMKELFKDQPEWIEHTLDVLHYAEQIMDGEKVEAKLRELVTVTVLLHDSSVLEAERQYGSMGGKYQELVGAGVARQILEKVGYGAEETERVCYIVANHHTFSKVDGLDFQIQWEADLLVNLAGREVRNDSEKLRLMIKENFRTATGQAIAESRYL